MFARLVALAPVGLLSLPLPDVTLGGLLLTQSCTSKLTFGFCTRLVVFLEEGFEVIMIVGPAGSWDHDSVVEGDAGRELDGR